MLLTWKNKISLATAIIFCLNIDGAMAANLAISNVTGISDGGGVVSGKWTGQPLRAPSTASNKYKNYYAVDSQNGSYYWDIAGSNFTGTRGSIWLVDENLNQIRNIKTSIVNWTNNSIRVVPQGDYNLTAIPGAKLIVTLDKVLPRSSSARTAIYSTPIVGIIQSRAYGQCTWFVAKRRLDAGKAIPPSAFRTNITIPPVGGIDSGYVPQQWDALNYASMHVGIITSTPLRVVNGDGSITWSFTLEEMNASWNEASSSSARVYKLSKPQNGVRRVLTGIGSNASSSLNYYASALYR